MREGFSDRALESRFLTEETGHGPLRPDISIHLPRSLKEEARELRNRLLAWRFHARHAVAPDPSRLVDGVAPRLNQTALALLSIVDDASLRDRIAAELVRDEARTVSERGTSIEATVLAAICEAGRDATGAGISVSAITNAVSRKTSGDSQDYLSPKSVGSIIRTKLHLATQKSRGIYVVPHTERARIAALAARYGILIEPDSNPQ